MSEIESLKNIIKRERLARKQTEKILEEKSREIYEKNEQLTYLLSKAYLEVENKQTQVEKHNENLRLLFQNHPLPIIIYDVLSNEILSVNSKSEKKYGYTNKEFLKLNIQDLYSFESQIDLDSFLISLQKNEDIEEINDEWVHHSKSGTRFDVSITSSPTLFDNKKARIIIVLDITDNKSSNLALLKSEEKYRGIIENLDLGLLEVDMDNRIIKTYPSFERLTGYSENELVGKNPEEVLLSDDSKIIMSNQDKLRKKGLSSVYEVKIKKKNGELIWVMISGAPFYNLKGEIIGTIGIHLDITERKLAGLVLQKSEEKYRSIFENLKFGIVEVDLENRITRVYKSFLLLTGYEEIDLIGKNAYKLLLHPNAYSKENIRIFKEKGVSSVYEVQIKKKNGDYIWVLISGAPFYDLKGKIAGTIGIHLDISNQKNMEHSLKVANDKALASSKAKELFLANMSHEIRTPLNAVIGLSNLLNKTGLNDLQYKYVSNIEKSSKNLLLLVNDILDIAKIESGKLSLSLEPFNIKDLMTNVLASVEYQASAKGLELVIDIDKKLKNSYLGDELKVLQVLINLCNNAIKFTKKGKVSVSIKLKSRVKDIDELLFIVNDTGKGIDSKAIDSIFGDFNQEDFSITKEFGGTGLGLSISQKIIKLMGSKLLVDSKLGKGTKFYFGIKLKSIQKENQSEVQEKKIINWSNIKILIAEDNLVNQFVIEATLKTWGTNPKIVSNGEEVINELSKNEYDLILMDMQMPIMDGLTATNVIRQTLKMTIPIIAFTANALKTEKEKCLNIGMDGYVTKPFKEFDLKNMIISLIDVNYC